LTKVTTQKGTKVSSKKKYDQLLNPANTFSEGTLRKGEKKLFKTVGGAVVKHVIQAGGAVEALSSANAAKKAAELTLLAGSMGKLEFSMELQNGFETENRKQIRTVKQAIEYVASKKAKKSGP